MIKAGSQHCGIFGGTFDPFHLGHLGAVRQIIAPAGLQQIRVIPAAIPPHRDQPGATPAQRLDMVRIALSEETDFLVDDRELLREGNSYTVDTVEALYREFPDTRFSLILGLDAALGLDRWHRWQHLLGLVNILVMRRPGWDLSTTFPDWWQTAIDAPETADAGRISLMDIEPLDISASAIRRHLVAGEDVSHLLHPGVLDYIRAHRLYTSLPNVE